MSAVSQSFSAPKKIGDTAALLRKTKTPRDPLAWKKAAPRQLNTLRTRPSEKTRTKAKSVNNPSLDRTPLPTRAPKKLQQNHYTQQCTGLALWPKRHTQQCSSTVRRVLAQHTSKRHMSTLPVGAKAAVNYQYPKCFMTCKLPCTIHHALNTHPLNWWCTRYQFCILC